MRVRPPDSLHRLRMTWAPSPLRRLLRHRLVQVLILGAVAAFAIGQVSSSVAALDSERAAWAELVPVAVVQRPVSIGQPVGPAVDVDELPRALVPADAVSTVGPERLAKVDLYPGEIVLSTRLTSIDDVDDTHPGSAALTLPVSVQLPLLAVGDLVDLWIIDSANHSSKRVVQRVVVLAFSERNITVAVPPDQIQAATAAALRPVTVTLLG